MKRKEARIEIQNHFSDLKSFYKPTSVGYLLKQYGDEERYYHNEMHIAEILGFVGQFQKYIMNPLVVKSATLWHDASYQTQDENGAYLPDQLNVTNSAQAFNHYASDKFPETDRNATLAMIQATDGHRLPESDKGHYAGFRQDVGILLDLDIFQFAKPWAEFEQNTHDIRQEFSWVDDKRFYLARANILEKFAARDRLYHVVPTREQWEKQARSNLDRSIKELRAQALSM